MVVSRSPELHTDGTIETLHPHLDIALEVVVNILSLFYSWTRLLIFNNMLIYLVFLFTYVHSQCIRQFGFVNI